MNIELTKNNHFVWGYNNIPWTSRTHLYDRFFSQYGKASSSYLERPTSLRDESITTAKSLAVRAKALGKIPMVFYSGGLDSEMVVASFLESGENFSVGHLKYLPNYNSYDTEWVNRFSKKHNLDLKEFTVDTINFLTDSKTFNHAVKNNARFITNQLVAHLMDLVKNEYYPIIGNGEPYLFRENTNPNEPSRWIFKELEHMMVWYNHAVNNKIESCPGFFQWSPEITLSFLLDPIIKNLVNNKVQGKITSRSSKYYMYNNAFPEYNFEIRRKYMGNETISKSLLNHINSKLTACNFYDKNSSYSYEYNIFLKHHGYGN
jgi:hypothetical protein